MTSQFESLKKFAAIALIPLTAMACQGSGGSGSIVPIVPATLSCPSTDVAYGVTVSNNLICFSLTTPATVAGSIPLTGMTAGENMMAIDMRPATKVLYGIGSTGQLYTIDTTTGLVTAVGTAVTYTGATSFGMDFNPTVDRIRVVTNNALNMRLNPDTGAVAATDNPVDYTGVEAVAYANNYAGALTTTLYDIGITSNNLIIQNPPNNGTLTTVGTNLGFNTDVNTSFDIYTDSTFVNHGYAVLTPLSATFSQLFTIDLSAGTATLVGEIEAGEVVRAFAVGL
jgi:hypothetical protein